MAATISVDVTIPLEGGYDLVKGTIAFDSSYPTGGEALDPSNIARLEFASIQGGGTTATGLGYVFNWDTVNQKVVVVWGNAGTASVLPEVTNATDLSALTNVPFIGLVSY